MATDPQKEKSGLEHTAQAAGAVKGAIKAGKALASHFDLSTLYFAPDQHNNEQFYKIIDDIMIIDGKAPADELKKYYRF